MNTLHNVQHKAFVYMESDFATDRYNVEDIPYISIRVNLCIFIVMK